MGNINASEHTNNQIELLVEMRARQCCSREEKKRKIDSTTGQPHDPATKVAAPRRDFSRQWQRRYGRIFFFRFSPFFPPFTLLAD